MTPEGMIYGVRVCHAATVFLDWVHVDPIMLTWLTINITWRCEFSMFGHSWSFLYLLTRRLSVNVSGLWLHIWHFMALQGVTQFWAKEVVLQVTAHALPKWSQCARELNDSPPVEKWQEKESRKEKKDEVQTKWWGSGEYRKPPNWKTHIRANIIWKTIWLTRRAKI